MTKREATKWVREHDDDDDLDTDDLHAAFVALYERQPDAQDEAEGLWSHLCAAVR